MKQAKWFTLIISALALILLPHALLLDGSAASRLAAASPGLREMPTPHLTPPPLDEDIMPVYSPRTVESFSSSDYVVVPVYFVPNNIAPDTRYLALVNQRMQWVQAWYGWQMRDVTFTLAPAVTVIGNHDLDWYYETEDPSDWGYPVWSHIFSDLTSLGFPYTSNRILGVFFHHAGQGAPALGGGSLSGGGQFLVAIDKLIDDCRGAGCIASIAGGGVAHELGHAFGLPHPEDEPDVGHSVMSWGLYGFPETGLLNSSLNPERDKLHSNPMFNQPLGLVNPSFEDCLDHWTVSLPSSLTCPETRHSGVSALQLAPTASGVYQVYQDIAVSGGMSYDFGVWVKLRGGVILYSEENYGGIAETFIGNDNCLNDNPVGNDTVSSIQVPYGHEVMLYEHCDYGGRSETFANNDPNLSDNPIDSDTVSSLKINCLSHSLPADMSFDIRLEAYDSGGLLLATEIIDVSGTFCWEEWVHLGKVITIPSQASRIRTIINVQAISGSAVALIDDLLLQPSPGIPPQPFAVLNSTQMPFDSARPTLKWNDTAWATSYRIQVADNSQFNQPVVDAVSQWPWHKAPTDLQWDIPYYWRIQARNGSGMSPWLYAGQFIAQSASTYESDEFETKDLDTTWSWVREDPTHWGWDGPASKGYQGEIKIVLQPGSLDGTTNNARNILLRSVTANHIAIGTRLRFSWGSPNHNGEQAGLIIYQDDDNFIKLVRGYADGYVIGLGFEQGGQTEWYPVTARENTLYLKLERNANAYRGYYSPDGFIWYSVGPLITTDWNDPQVGLIAFAGDSTSQYDAAFDWWRVVDLNVMPEPEATQANFDASPTSGVAPLNVLFTNTSTGDYIESLWELGDGTIETLENPTHKYTASGIYTVTLTVSGPGGSDSKAKYITVQGERHSIFIPLVLYNVSNANFVLNPGFEDGQYSPSGTPLYWMQDSWQPTSTFTWDNTEAHSGDKSVRIDSASANDAWWIQTISVQPNTDYELSGWTKTDNVEHVEGSAVAGANLCLYGTWDHTPGLFGTNDWTYVKMQFNSDSNTSITVACRLGYWAGTATGTMWCDDIELKIDYSP